MADRLARERLLTALLDSAEEAILSVSLDGTIETWSAGAERLYGYTIEAADQRLYHRKKLHNQRALSAP